MCQEPGESSKEAKNRDIGREKFERQGLVVKFRRPRDLKTAGFFICLFRVFFPPLLMGLNLVMGEYDEGRSVKTMNLERNGVWETERRVSFFQASFRW